MISRFGPYSPGRQAMRALAAPVAEQDVEGVVGAGGEDDVVGGEPGQRADGGPARVEHRRGGLGGDVAADLGFVPGVRGRGVDRPRSSAASRRRCRGARPPVGGPGRPPVARRGVT